MMETDSWVWIGLSAISSAVSLLLLRRSHSKARAVEAALSEAQALAQKLHWTEEALTQARQWERRYETLQVQHDQERAAATKALLQQQAAELRYTHLKERHEALVAEQGSAEQRQAERFQQIADSLFIQSEQRLRSTQQEALSQLLSPFQTQLSQFHTVMEQKFSEESKERHTLAFAVRELQTLNQQLAQEALQLTKALKGDQKIQGTWGEIILEKTLTLSGLRKGFEYETQVSYPGEDGELYRPDVTVNLPDNRVVIIDAKLSLTAYERYFNSESSMESAQALKAHVDSVVQHIKGLAKREYHTLKGLKTVDYVLLFVPIEPAFALALQTMPEILELATKSNVLLVSPSSLLIALRTIDLLWRYERQSQNAQTIAQQAGQLYDKCCLLLDSMQKLGRSLEKSQICYEETMKRLVQGRGNLIRGAEKMRSFGIPVKKPISQEWLEKLEGTQEAGTEPLNPELSLHPETVPAPLEMAPEVQLPSSS